MGGLMEPEVLRFVGKAMVPIGADGWPAGPPQAAYRADDLVASAAADLEGAVLAARVPRLLRPVQDQLGELVQATGVGDAAELNEVGLAAVASVLRLVQDLQRAARRVVSARRAWARVVAEEGIRDEMGAPMPLPESLRALAPSAAWSTAVARPAL